MKTINSQPIEKRNLRPDGLLEVHSVFKTIQGEGPFTGQSAVFVRLAGCNLQCPGCDTEYTLNSSESATLPSLILSAVKSYNTEGLVVITGGEPFRQNIQPFVSLLLSAGYTVQIETNGTLAPPNIAFYELCSRNLNERNKCFVVCSPKTGKVNAELLPVICAYKYVMSYNSVQSDGLPMLALNHSANPCVARPPIGFTGPVYLQPCDSKSDELNKLNLKACIKSVMDNGFTLQLQTHKLIGME